MITNGAAVHKTGQKNRSRTALERPHNPHGGAFCTAPGGPDMLSGNRFASLTERMDMCRFGAVLKSIVTLAVLMAACRSPLIVAADPTAASSSETATPHSTNGNGEPASANGPWRHRDKLIAIQQAILETTPMDSEGKPLSENPGPPFTYEEQTYDKPSRDWWWKTGKYTVVILGGLAVTYFTAGVAAPYVGGAIGGMAGLNGAAAVSYGLAFLGGGAVAAGGFGIAGGSMVVGVVTDLAISSMLEYSLYAFQTAEGLGALNTALLHVDANHDQAGAWEALRKEAKQAAASRKKYVVVTHAIASAFMRWAADENIERALVATNNTDAAELTMSDRQRVLMTAAICLLEDVRRLEPHSSLIHHALGNAYWWLSVRGGYKRPEGSAAAIELPSTSRLKVSGDDEAGCYEAALWHYNTGAASEPRNVHVRINWANSLQADGTLHEAIAVVGGALPFIGSCNKADRAQLLRTHAMLQYQAFTRSPVWDRFTAEGEFPSLQDSPPLTAAMQGYTRVVELDEADLAAWTSLAQIYREAEPTKLDAPTSVKSLDEVQYGFLKAVIKQEEDLASRDRETLPESYKPGQLIEHYQELLRWAFDGLSKKPLRGETLEMIYNRVKWYLTFARDNELAIRPFDRDLVFTVYGACKDYNEETWYGDYGISVFDRELSEKPTK